MRNGMKKCIAMFLCLAMVFSILPAISVKAAGTNSIYIATSEFDKADVFYSIDGGSEIDFNTVSQNDTNKVITDITVGSTVKIRVAPKGGRNIEVRVKEGLSGDAGEAYEGTWDPNTNIYTFTTSNNNGSPLEYAIKLEENNNNSSGGEGGGNDPNNGGGSWEDQYTQYLAPGINILSQWVGNSVGDISY